MPPEQTPQTSSHARRLPPWLKRPLGGGPEYARTADAIGQGHLHTICQEARCPNRGECWTAGTATFLILGDQCTRRCGFCSVKGGRPAGFIDNQEPGRLADAVARMGLRHVVITSVTRDDLPDGGASQFADCIKTLRARVPGVTVEILTPDFRRCQDEALATLLPLAPFVWGHNVETVPRLYLSVRPGSNYADTLDLLRRAAASPGIIAKSSIMLGLSETRDEVLSVIDDLVSIGVKRMTIGQYLRPTAEQFDVVEFVTPEVFSELGAEARRRGIPWVISTPFARSSYHAELSEAGCSSPSVSEGQPSR
ncbi:lipoyl synthase [bacterium]|nr:lipoyl synthase [bacterium]